jgi:serine/threonine-protein kinase SRPK3
MAQRIQRLHLPRSIPQSAGCFEPRLAARRSLSATADFTPHVPRARSSIAHVASRVWTKMAHSSASVSEEPSLAIEEETVRGYNANHYYPVQIGYVFKDRYRVVGKLGYGSASTVWLCHDLRNAKQYVALKVYINSSRVQRELQIYTHINNIQSKHGGKMSLRRLLDSFEIQGPSGKHLCLVHEALGMSFEELGDLIPGQGFASDLVRESLRGILRALHFLREEAHIIHTGLPRVLPFINAF